MRRTLLSAEPCMNRLPWSPAAPGGTDTVACLLGSLPVTLDVAKMYNDDIALDPGSLPREYGGSGAGAGVFCIRADAGKGVPARKRR
jgi:hypothetical protein